MALGWMLAVIAVALTGLFVLNIYIRIKVLRSYGRLTRNRVEFAAVDIFSAEKMEEVASRYPDQRDDIITFSRNIRITVWMASVFLVVIIVFGWILIKHS